MGNAKRAGRNPADFCRLMEVYIAEAEAAGEDLVIATHYARRLLDLAKRAKRRGRQPLRTAEIVKEAAVIKQARSRKAALIAGGMSRAKAKEVAAEEASQALRPRNVAVSTIIRRME